jgi:signal transduction histidine kinase
LNDVDLPARWEMFPSSRPAAERAALLGVRAIGLGAVVYSVVISDHAPGLSGRHLVVAIGVCLATLGWLTWMLTMSRPRVAFTAVVVMGVSGGVLAAASQDSGAVAFGAIAALTAGANTDMSTSFGVTIATVAAFLSGAAAIGPSIGVVIGYPATFAGMWAVGLTRRAYVDRAEQAERLLAESRRAIEAETAAAALAERTRIARDIHDVLAHSLAAVSVNLEAASGLLGPAASGSAEVAKALECVNRASDLTREGLADAKRAVQTLRDAGPPLAERLAGLVDDFGAAGDAEASLKVEGTPRPVPAEAGLAVFRAVQEALTNARKHAAGQPVSVALSFLPSEIKVEVTNPVGHGGGSLSGTGGGYGLAGLAERAAHAGGTFEAGPADGAWRVYMRIPA